MLWGLIKTLRFITGHPLNRDRWGAAVKRYIGWQIGSRLVPGPVAVPFVNGTRLLISPGMTGATGNLYCGLHEFEDMAFVLHGLRPDDVFVDVGANVGSYTVLASGAVGARSVSCEPVPAAFARLRSNLLLNAIQARADARNVGVGRESGALRFTAGLDTINHVVLEEGGGRHPGSVIRVPVEPLDDLVGDQEPALIKIDVEGFETEVIEGGRRTLAKPSLIAVIMELNGSGARYGFDDTALHHRMLEWGFRPYAYAPFARTLTGQGGRARNSGNTLYIRDIDKARERVRTAPSFSVLRRAL